MVITAKSTGIVSLTSNSLFEGVEVRKGEVLLAISGSGLADDNFTLKYNEARTRYEKSRADYERSVILAQDKIISEKDLLAVKNEYENAKARFDHLSANFNAGGERVQCPMDGSIRQLYVQNGDFVSAGDALLVVSQTRTLVIRAEVPQKQAPLLENIHAVNIRDLAENRTWSLEELDGKVLSYGKSARQDGFLVPVTLEIRNDGNFFPGGMVELYLRTMTNSSALTIPNTALMEEQGNFFVWVQITPELFEKREVSLGKTDGQLTEVTGRLSETERIVTRGAIMVKLSQATGTLDAHSGHVH
jgi:RND family efflux transporter MFP subunit